MFSAMVDENVIQFNAVGDRLKIGDGSFARESSARFPERLWLFIDQPAGLYSIAIWTAPSIQGQLVHYRVYFS
jgi:hypothetical protein